MYVHNSAVDVAKLLEAKQPRTMGAVIEYIALEDPQSAADLPGGVWGQYGRSIDWDSSSIGGWVWHLPGGCQ